MTPEEKVLQRMREVLIADSDIVNFVSHRIYVSHISTISKPTYPAISFFLQKSRPVMTGSVIRMQIQIDCWFPFSEYTFEDVMNVHRNIRENLHDQVNNLINPSLDLKVMECKEIGSGPLLHEEDTDLLHYPVEYEVVAL